jgi:hypothetical protein
MKKRYADVSSTALAEKLLALLAEKHAESEKLADALAQHEKLTNNFLRDMHALFQSALAQLETPAEQPKDKLHS